MNMGIGFTEILVICVLILIFFGSKELPSFIREGAKWIAKIRLYSDKMKRELDDITRGLDPTNTMMVPEVKVRKEELRKKYLGIRKALDLQQRLDLSNSITCHLSELAVFKKAVSVMIYYSVGAEVVTRETIRLMLAGGKRVILPYCKTYGEIGMAEIKDVDKDLVKGNEGLFEPRPELQDNFFKSDLHLVVCPGVAFDIYGKRLGRGKAYYDKFLREIKGKIPIIGLSFDCQMSKEPLPFDYSDVSMDQIITENGMQLPESGMLPAYTAQYTETESAEKAGAQSGSIDSAGSTSVT